MLKEPICGRCGRFRLRWCERRARLVRDPSSGHARSFVAMAVLRARCAGCGHIQRKRLGFLASNLFYTNRFAYCVWRYCCQANIKDIALELNLDWDTIKTLENQKIRE